MWYNHIQEIVWVMSLLVSHSYMQNAAISCIYGCTLDHQKGVVRVPTTILPMVVANKVFTGQNCKIYTLPDHRKCSSLSPDLSTFLADGKSFYLPDIQATWFEADKFCHSRGWLLGELPLTLNAEKELTRQVQNQLGDADVWVAANAFARKGFSSSETGKNYEQPKVEKGAEDKSCLLVSGWKSQALVKKAETCSKKARFVCQLHPLCTITLETCEAEITADSQSCYLNKVSEGPLAWVTANCSVPNCYASQKCDICSKPKSMKVFNDFTLRPFGTLRQSCGKYYLFLRQFFPLNMATDFCCSLGMKLVSVETKNELACLTKLVQKMTSIKELGTRWWTSGTDRGCPGKMAWCGAGEMYSEQEMGYFNGSTNLGGKCVALKAQKSGELSLEAASCSENNRPLCEGNFPPSREYLHQECPASRCKVDMDYYPIQTIGIYPSQDTKRLGIGMYVDNRFYVAGKTKATWYEAQETCCSLGMTLMILSDVEKYLWMNNLRTTLMNTMNADKSKLVPDSSPTKPMFLWTAGFVGLKRKTPVWCHSGDDFPDFNSWPGVRVQLKPRGAGGNCVLAEVGPEKSTQLWTADCEEKQHFVCEIITDDTPACKKAVCFFNGSTEEYKQKTKLSEITYLENNKKGFIISACNRQIFVSAAPVYFSQIVQECIALGMQPLQIDTAEDWKCLLKSISATDFKSGNEAISIHLPFSDVTCYGKHVWCGTNEPLAKNVTEAIFASFEDKTIRNFRYQPCVLLWRSSQINSGTVPFRDECQRLIGTSRRFICQLPAP